MKTIIKTTSIVFILLCVSLSIQNLQASLPASNFPHPTSNIPNVLLIIADDASRSSFGAYGCEYIETPAFDKLATDGVLFSNAYTCNPKCAPSRMSVLTGRYSWQLEESCNHSPIVAEKWQFYPYILESNGYEIAGTGKGWGPGQWRGKSSYSNHENPAGYLNSSIKLKPPFKKISNVDYAANFNQFLKNRDKTKPFCFWLGTFEPHRAYEKDSWKKAGKDLSEIKVPACFPDNDVVRGDLADYAIEVEWFDKHLGEAIQNLKDAGLYENTIIIVTSDHGMPFPHVKGQIYDESFHIPLLVVWGDKIKAGREISDFVNFPDIAPTIFDLLAMEQHEQFTGESFKKQLLSNKSGRIDKSKDFAVLGKERHDMGRTDPETGMLSVGYPIRAIRTEKYLYLRNYKPNRWPVGNPEYSYRNCDGSPTMDFIISNKEVDQYKKYYALSFDFRQDEELYDMEKDLDCVNNLAKNPEYKAVKEELEAQLIKVLTEQEDPRILGKGEIFDYYPYSKIDKQREVYDKPDYDPINIFKDYQKTQKN